MKPILFLFIMTIFTPLIANGSISKKQVKELGSLQGFYRTLKGSSSSCSNGYLSIVGSGKSKGLRIGHNIFLGPFEELTEISNDKSCRVKSKIKMNNNELTVLTTVDKCPYQKNKEEGISTQKLNFSKNKLKYIVIETGYLCLFEKTGQRR